MGKDKWGKLNMGWDHRPCITIQTCLVVRDISWTGCEASTVKIPARINEAGAAEAPDAADKKTVLRRALYQQYPHAGWKAMFNACQWSRVKKNIGLNRAWHLRCIQATFMPTVQLTFSPLRPKLWFEVDGGTGQWKLWPCPVGTEKIFYFLRRF